MKSIKVKVAVLTLMCILPFALNAHISRGVNHEIDATGGSALADSGNNTQPRQGEPAKKYPEITFEKTTIDFGLFSQDQTLHSCVFKFTNTGKAKLVINYVGTSCGCTVADYPKDYISPGGTGEIRVTYDSKGKLPGKFRKTIQIYTNCKDDLTRLYIIGEMTDVAESDIKKK